ncbi:Ti-type conjugative transfer system protein TraG [Bartonella henselae]|uniref:Ti-type conjugative transfer system protein TraG n=1 Tax=Bartonella henselae TaxID=38323 RepID=UPI0004379119|nr:Ti-type conjugative transfer system protein TraG [Bartonella henselae]MDM9983352.1 Ti-type conjugative transfer system protein TraG [Bartonella henselae]MDM9984689.1 Ti-type conjugative transfer system protein TraG [Bartonella henselae]MDM9986033.1 Ti-type conjugative transfer system protein TraG [Bartonella henselae]MDM9987788.1 Ti-type conjugative transfer system protein TraG [Bartonella henselae]MDM9989151.1 Ti-type conjugative transfer system protein TraG [Bartonella henselae]
MKYTKTQLALISMPIASGALTIFLVPHMLSFVINDLKTNQIYWYVRSEPLLTLMLVAAVSLFYTLSQKLHLRKAITFVSTAFFCITALYYIGSEIKRLNPYVGQQGITWGYALKFMDPMVVFGVILGFVLLAIQVIITSPRTSNVKRAKKGIFGDAAWMNLKEAARIFPSNGQIVIGERYRVDQDNVRNIPFAPGNKTTWGKGGTAPLLTFNLDFGSTHMIFFAGSGGYKTTSTVVPTCLTYTGPIVCLDPSTEIAPMVKFARKKMGNRNVIILDPNSLLTKNFNVLDWLLDENIPRTRREANIVSFSKLLLSEKKSENSSAEYFSTQAHNLLTALLAHVIFSDEYEDSERNLKTLRAILSQSETAVVNQLRMIQETTPSPFIREMVGIFTEMADQTFSGVYTTASKDTQWLSLSNYADLVCGNDFASSDIANGKTDVFLNLPASILNSYPAIGRVIIGAFLNAMVTADGNYKKRVLFVLDEVDLLGYMNILEEARDRGRKYGTSLMLFYQSSGQLVNHFGEAGARSWFESCSFVSYAAIKDLQTAKDISERCGQMTIEVTGTSKSRGLSLTKGSQNINYQQRALILPHEIIQEMRQDEQIILMQGHPPLRCGRAIYFRRKEMLAATEKNRFAPQAKKS